MIDTSSRNRNDFVLSRSTGRRATSSNRKAISFQINRNLAPPQYLEVHWERKIIKDSSDESKEHIAVARNGTPHYESGKLGSTQAQIKP